MKQIENEKEIMNSLISLLYDLHYSLATDAASKGDYSLAGSYITDLIKQHGEKPVLLDLNAKINAQQGNFKQAEFLWQKCLKVDPENNSYLAALERLHKVQRLNASGNVFIFRLIGGIVALSLLLFLFLYSSRINRDIRGALDSLNKQQNDIFIYLNEQKSLQEVNIVDSVLFTIARDLSEIEGLAINHSSSEITVHFEYGLFNTVDHLISSQKSVISALAKALEPYADKISVLILGCTDDTPIIDSSSFKSNNALSIARAGKVYDVFYTESRFLLQNLKIGSGNESDAPFLNDTVENQRKNRTAIIKIEVKSYQ